MPGAQDRGYQKNSYHIVGSWTHGNRCGFPRRVNKVRLEKDQG